MGTAEQIDDLSDDRAITVLALVLERRKQLPDVTRLREMETETAAAAKDPESVKDPETGQSLPVAAEPATDGDLARSTLSYLLTEQPGLAATVDKAIVLSATDDDTRLEPVTMAVGALVIIALQTDVKLEKNTAGKWKFAIHKKAMSDSALGGILTKLISKYFGQG